MHTVLRSLSLSFMLLLLGLIPACSDDDPGMVQATDAEPILTDVSVEPNPFNALSTLVFFEAQHADSARVVYTHDDTTLVATPWYAAVDGQNRIATLGLLASTLYTHRVEAKNAVGPAASEEAQLASGALPAALGRVELALTGDPTPGYLLAGMQDDGYAMAFDETGQICWYRHLEGYVGRHIMQTPRNTFAAFVGSTTGYQPTYGYYAEFAASGEIITRHQAPPGFYTDSHELLLTMQPGGLATHLFTYDIRETDLTAMGGPADALVAGHQIMRFTPDGSLDFMWNAWDHFVIEDWVEEPLDLINRPNCDFDHPNSLEIDRDGNYIASFRNMGEITKIDSRTGDVIWRFGGRNSQFTIVGDPLGLFSGQHSVRVMENGNLLLFDNGLRHTPPESRGVEYALDTGSVPMTATMVWEFRRTPLTHTPFTGSIQRLENGNTLVGFAATGLVSEVRPDGMVVWEGQLRVDGGVLPSYRMERIASLYEFRSL